MEIHRRSVARIMALARTFTVIAHMCDANTVYIYVRDLHMREPLRVRALYIFILFERFCFYVSLVIAGAVTGSLS